MSDYTQLQEIETLIQEIQIQLIVNPYRAEEVITRVGKAIRLLGQVEIKIGRLAESGKAPVLKTGDT